jgi:hypothetical protein
MSITFGHRRRPAGSRPRRRLPRVAIGLLAVAGSGAGAFAALGSSAAFAGTNGQQLALYNPSSDSVTFNLSGYNQYGQYSTQSVPAYGGQTVNDYDWWWQYGLTVHEIDNTTGQQTNFEVDVPAVQSGSDWFTVTGSEQATLALSANPNPGTATQPITLQATVTPSAQAAQVSPATAATGTVTFYQFNLSTGANTPLGTATVTNGAARLTTTSLPAGTDYWFASYSGDNLNLATTTIVNPVTVTAAQPRLQVSANPLHFGDIVAGTTSKKLLTITNTGNIPWTPTGASTNSPVLGLSGGTCFTVGTLAPGAACTFQSIFAPTAVGVTKGVITVTSNFTQPLTFNLVGTGVARPSITSISPKSGPAAGGTKITITGTNLVGLTSAHLGTVLATNLTCPSATTCTVVTPAGTATKDVTVTNAAGKSATSTADRFTY